MIGPENSINPYKFSSINPYFVAVLTFLGTCAMRDGFFRSSCHHQHLTVTAADQCNFLLLYFAVAVAVDVLAVFAFVSDDVPVAVVSILTLRVGRLVPAVEWSPVSPSGRSREPKERTKHSDVLPVIVVAMIFAAFGLAAAAGEPRGASQELVLRVPGHCVRGVPASRRAATRDRTSELQ